MESTGLMAIKVGMQMTGCRPGRPQAAHRSTHGTAARLLEGALHIAHIQVHLLVQAHGRVEEGGSVARHRARARACSETEGTLGGGMEMAGSQAAQVVLPPQHWLTPGTRAAKGRGSASNEGSKDGGSLPGPHASWCSSGAASPAFLVLISAHRACCTRDPKTRRLQQGKNMRKKTC